MTCTRPEASHFKSQGLIGSWKSKGCRNRWTWNKHKYPFKMTPVVNGDVSARTLTAMNPRVVEIKLQGYVH